MPSCNGRQQQLQCSQVVPWLPCVRGLVGVDSVPSACTDAVLLVVLMRLCAAQVCLRGFILRRGYETSYTCLARRAAKTNNFWNRLIRRGSALRRVSMYGALQLAYTLICCVVFLPTYFSYPLALAFQVGP